MMYEIHDNGGRPFTVTIGRVRDAEGRHVILVHNQAEELLLGLRGQATIPRGEENSSDPGKVKYYPEGKGNTDLIFTLFRRLAHFKNSPEPPPLQEVLQALQGGDGP